MCRTTLACLFLPALLAGCRASSVPSNASVTSGALPSTDGMGTGTTGSPSATNDGSGGSKTSVTASTSGGTSTTGGGLSAGGDGMSSSSGGVSSNSGGVSSNSDGASAGAGGTGGGSVDDRDAYFGDWPDAANPASVGKRVAQVFDDEVLNDSKHYKGACAWYGSLVVSAELDEQEMLDSLIAKYAPYENTWSQLLAGQGHVDENVFGIVPLEISLHSDEPLYLQEGLALADHQQANIQTQKRFAIDDMFMITALQVQAYRASGQLKYLDLAASVMIEYLNRLQQGDGLFYHHEDFHHKWARGNGWFAAGMAELIRELPETHIDYAAIRTGYEKMMTGLLSYQLTEGAGAGLWQQIVDSTDSRNWPETSGSAMFTYALVSGVRRGWLETEPFGPAARAAWLALVAKLTAQGQLQDISDWAYKPTSHEGGPSYAGDEENYYFERPRLIGDNHGQAPMLWSAAALARARKP